MNFESDELIELARKLQFFSSTLSFCLREIQPKKIVSIEQATAIIAQAESSFIDIEKDLKINDVFDRANIFLNSYDVHRSLIIAGIQHRFPCNYKYMVANYIVNFKYKEGCEHLNKWIDLRDSLRKVKGGIRLTLTEKFDIPAEILWVFSFYLAGEDKSLYIQENIDVLSDYKDQLSVLYSYHSAPAFRTFMKHMRAEGEIRGFTDQGIAGEGAFSLDAIELEIERLKAKIISKRKDATLLERQLAENIIDIFYRHECKRVPSAVSALMGGRFVKNILDNRTIFRLWKNYKESEKAIDVINAKEKGLNSTVSYRYGSVRSSNYERLKEISTNFKSSFDI